MVTCKEGQLSIAQWLIHFVILLFSLFMAKKDISLTIINVVLFLLVGCEIASVDVIKCADLTFLLPIMFVRRAFPVRMSPFAESAINNSTWQRKKKGRHKFTYFGGNITNHCPEKPVETSYFSAKSAIQGQVLFLRFFVSPIFKIYSGAWMAPYRGRNSYSQSASTFSLLSRIATSLLYLKIIKTNKF